MLEQLAEQDLQAVYDDEVVFTGGGVEPGGEVADGTGRCRVPQVVDRAAEELGKDQRAFGVADRGPVGSVNSREQSAAQTPGRRCRASSLLAQPVAVRGRRRGVKKSSG